VTSGSWSNNGSPTVYAATLEVAEVDIVVLDTVSLELKGRVVQEDKILYCADEARRVAFARTRYFDFLPTLEAHTRRFIRRVAEKGL